MRRKYVIMAFQKEGDELTFESSLFEMPLTTLQKIFNYPPDDEMHYVNPISIEVAKRLAEHVPVDFNFDENDYFLEERAEDAE